MRLGRALHAAAVSPPVLPTWLQYRPILSWKMAAGLRTRADTPRSCGWGLGVGGWRLGVGVFLSEVGGRRVPHAHPLAPPTAETHKWAKPTHLTGPKARPGLGPATRTGARTRQRARVQARVRVSGARNPDPTPAVTFVLPTVCTCTQVCVHIRSPIGSQGVSCKRRAGKTCVQAKSSLVESGFTTSVTWGIL